MGVDVHWYEEVLKSYPANTTRLSNDVWMLAQRLRRWPNIKTSLFQRVVFAEQFAICYHILGGGIHYTWMYMGWFTPGSNYGIS